MKFLLFVSLALLAFSQARELGFRRYDGYQVFTVEVTNPEQFEVLKTLYHSDKYDFWTSPRKIGKTDIMASPEEIPQLLTTFKTNGMQFVVKVEDVETLVELEREQSKRASTGKISWTAYPTFAEIEEFMTELDRSPVATVSVIGKSFEDRNIYAVKISTGGPPKKSVLIDANIHSREWIAGTAATWMLNELTTNTDAYRAILEQIDLYIIPMVNPDGFEWSRTRDRMWRKTRSVRAGTSCIGCDPNRNFEFMFGGESTSPNPCSDIFHGGEAWSESEARAVRDFVLSSEASGIKFYAYMTFHSYSQLWLLPWGYTSGAYPDDYPQQLSLGQASIAALRGVSGTVYETGQGADMLYGVGGASDDWAKDHGIKYTATIEMRDRGANGFILPPAQIIPNAREVWAALQVVFQRVIETPAE